MRGIVSQACVFCSPLHFEGELMMQLKNPNNVQTNWKHSAIFPKRKRHSLNDHVTHHEPRDKVLVLLYYLCRDDRFTVFSGSLASPDRFTFANGFGETFRLFFDFSKECLRLSHTETPLDTTGRPTTNQSNEAWDVAPSNRNMSGDRTVVLSRKYTVHFIWVMIADSFDLFTSAGAVMSLDKNVHRIKSARFHMNGCYWLDLWEASGGIQQELFNCSGFQCVSLLNLVPPHRTVFLLPRPPCQQRSQETPNRSEHKHKTFWAFSW